MLILKCPSAFGMHSWCCYLPICMSSQFALSDGFRFANLHSRMDSDGFGSESQNNWHSTELREKDFGRRTYLHSLSSLIIENCSAGAIFSFCSIQFDSFCSEICIILISRIEVFSLHLSLHFQSDNIMLPKLHNSLLYYVGLLLAMFIGDGCFSTVVVQQNGDIVSLQLKP